MKTKSTLKKAISADSLGMVKSQNATDDANESIDIITVIVIYSLMIFHYTVDKNSLHTPVKIEGFCSVKKINSR